jgi:hypothetical protein
MADIQAKLQALSEEFTKLQQGVYSLVLSVTFEFGSHNIRSPRHRSVKAKA